ncbi:amino acid adenylation domain-containing protein [Chryseobacterium sp. PS-8]|uniref:Amino acid adenylation domain-containing protein n=1 Tax=Chryseobacterium indicum TaxID=2766954 RepID=A0ABS9C6W9_9FLAO|nr:non-ribosomal peptide synthetase [Chryseobacterium sp. PS-8]MCF2220323.1 amino acid adenylation domain-containing protein [Chryseobacterium sp. PS-8]
MSTPNSKLDFEAINANKNITARNYWKNRLENYVSEDYFRRNKVKTSSFHTEEIITKADEKVCNTLNKIVNTPKAKHVFLLSVLGILAEKYSSNSDVTIFTTTYTESDTESKGFVFPVRMNDFGRSTFPVFLTELKNNILNDYKHSNYQLKKIINHEDGEIKDLPSVGMLVEGIQEVDAFDALSPDLLFVFNVDNGLSLKISYTEESYDKNYIKGIADHYFNLLVSLIDNKEKEIDSIELISDSEKQRIIKLFNNTEKYYPEDKTILDLFLEQVRKTPENVAVAYKDKKLTYQELDKRSNQVAHYLLEKFGDTNRVFGVQIDRSVELIITIFGILKAGGIYLPLSKNHPTDRILYTLDNSNACAIFTDTGKPEDFENRYDCLYVNELSAYSSTGINLAKPEKVAYIIYTSGSTGKPKGVLIKHTSMVNRLHWMQNEYQLTEHDTILQKTPLVFDVSIWELFLWSMSGAKLVLAAPGAEKDPQELCEIIQKENITVLHFVPSMLNAFLAYLDGTKQNIYNLESIRHLFTSGEELKATDAKAFLDYCTNAELHNLYGPTEATVDVSFHNVSRKVAYRSIPIGKPIDNTQLFIFNDKMQLQPVGVPGELFIGGVNLSAGYANQPELTKERFISNPLNPGSLLYKTGDLAKWLEDGSIEYLGRIDNQVKIRGNRIELGEIEFVIQSFPTITTVVVLPKDYASGVQLVGYLVIDEGFSEETLRNFLASQLPDYMIPSYFIIVDQIPVTTNGKVNREALLSIEVKSDEEYVAPETELQKLLLTYWNEILSTEKIGINDSFFRIGGDSILAIRLIGMINNYISANISMVDIYENDTIKKLADFIQKSEEKEYSAIFDTIELELEKFESEYKKHNQNSLIEKVYPMSDIEKAMCFIHKSRPDDILYFEQLMQPVIYETLDVDVFQKTLDLLVEKHEILRTGFDIEHFAHIIYKNVDTRITFHDYSAYSKDEQKRKIEEDMEKSRPDHFDLQAEKLWRIIIYKLQDSHHEILFEYHHAILDGWSFASLITEMNNTYLELLRGNAVKLETLETGFKDYITQEMFYKKNPETTEFWKKELKNYKKLTLNKTTDLKDFKSVRDVYPAKLLTDLEKIAADKNTTVKNILLSAYVYTMKMLSGETDILVGLVTFTRPLKKDGEKLLGCFLNTVPFRITIPENITWTQYIAAIDKKVLEVKKYDHLSLFEISNAIGSAGLGNPLFDTFFNYINWHVKENMKIAETVDQDDRTYFDTFLRGNTFFDVNYDVTNKNIICMHEYSSPFMTEERYAQYSDIFLTILDRIIRNSDEVINADDFFWNPLQENLANEFSQYENWNVEPGDILPLQYHENKRRIKEIESGIFFNKTISVTAVSEEKLNTEILEKSIQKIINTHDILRTVICRSENQYDQRFISAVNVEITEKYAVSQDEVNEIIEQEKLNSFDLNSSLLSAVLIRFINSDKVIVSFNFHNSIVDSSSAEKIVEEIFSAYQSENWDVNKETKLSYLGYSLWKQEKINKLYPELLNYWKNRLQNIPAKQQLPFIKAEKHSDVYSAAEKYIHIPESTFEKIIDFSDRNNIDVSSVLLSGFTILLNKYNQQEAIVVGSFVSGESFINKNLIGSFSRVIPFVSAISEQKTFEDYTKELNVMYHKDLENSLLSLDALKADLFSENGNANRDFDIIFQYNEKDSDRDIKIKIIDIDDSSEQRSLHLILNRTSNSITGKIRYNSEYLDAEMMNAVPAHFNEIITQLINNPALPIGDVSMLSSSEKDIILHDFNDSFYPFTGHSTVLDLLSDRVSEFSESTALIFGESEMSYSAFWDSSLRYGNYLRTEYGLNKGDLVGVLLERSEEMVLSLYGILCSGCAYVPIDINLPASRIEKIIEDSGIRVLVSRGRYVQDSLSDLCKLIDLDEVSDSINSYPVVSPVSVEGSDLAYVIYTSGSTGNPKGVMIEHGSLLNLVQSMDHRYPLEKGDRYLLKTLYSFDVSIAELFGWFHRGGSLVILGQDMEKNSVELVRAVRDYEISHINFVPSMFGVFMDTFESIGKDSVNSLQYIFLAGEVFPLEMLHKFKSYNLPAKIQNLYGPTETTVYSCGYNTDKWSSLDVRIPIGRALDNMGMYVLDSHHHLQPIGIWGELCVGGLGVARGYLNNSSLSTEKFITVDWLDSGRLYKTGDIGRWLSNGTLEIMGRLDHQVKLRGFRIELGEIESKILGYPGVSGSVVVLKEIGGDAHLVCYYTSEKSIPSSSLRDYLQSELPEYMVPQYYVHLDSFPLTSSGKISRNGLPDVDMSSHDPHVDVSNEIEEKLLAIWSDVLGISGENISAAKSFFELGGHSLKAMMLINKINKEFDITFPLEEVFEKTTIQKQAVYIKLINFLSTEISSVEAEDFSENIII